MFIEIYLILIIPKVQMTVFTVIIQKKMHCQLYFVTFDKIINSIKDRFHLTDDQIYVHLREILIKPFKEQDWEKENQNLDFDSVQHYPLSSLFGRTC